MKFRILNPGHCWTRRRLLVFLLAFGLIQMPLVRMPNWVVLVTDLGPCLLASYWIARKSPWVGSELLLGITLALSWCAGFIIYQYIRVPGLVERLFGPLFDMPFLIVHLVLPHILAYLLIPQIVLMIVNRVSGKPILQDGFLCPRCAYCLQGVPEARCPECGRAFTQDEVPAWSPHVYQPN